MKPDKTARERQLDYERVVFLYGSSGTGLLGILVATVLMAVVIADVYAPRAGLLWAGVVVGTYLPRVLLWITFLRRHASGSITPENVRPWEPRAVWASVVPYLCFAGAAFLPYGEETLTALLFFTVLAVLMIGGGTLLYSTSIGIMLVFLHVTFVAVIVRSIWEGERLLWVLAVTLVVAYSLLLRVILRGHRATVESLRLKIDSAHESVVDPLTGLYNRRRLDLFLDKLVPASKRSGRTFSVVLFDIDHFKRFNDTHGHKRGDEVLVAVAQILQACAREQDLVVRYGGEEFMAVLPATRAVEARGLAERVLEDVRVSTEVTTSAGIQELADGWSLEELIESADRALYAAKEAGRDRVHVAESL